MTPVELFLNFKWPVIVYTAWICFDIIVSKHNFRKGIRDFLLDSVYTATHV